MPPIDQTQPEAKVQGTLKRVPYVSASWALSRVEKDGERPGGQTDNVQHTSLCHFYNCRKSHKEETKTLCYAQCFHTCMHFPFSSQLSDFGFFITVPLLDPHSTQCFPLVHPHSSCGLFSILDLPDPPRPPTPLQDPEGSGWCFISLQNPNI